MEAYETVSIIIAGGVMILTILSMHHKQKRIIQDKHKEQMTDLMIHTEWKSTMELKIATIEKDTEKIKEDGKSNLNEIWVKIEKMEASHDKDMEDTNNHIEDLISEIRKQNVCINEKNEKNYSSLLGELNKISQSLAVLTAQFQDHKSDHNGK
jgi:hypothetical protein